MYLIDRQNNSLHKTQKCTFKELGFEERKHLQEWIAKEPSVLGEKLLIIQKEFDGFKDTKERLDLLAIDTSGNLVVIENKLDDSGRDVTWQSIKYASYCSQLSKQDIISIYQKYVGSADKAERNICDFFDNMEIEDIELNNGRSSQRIILVAANFRKEVTSSVVWLSNFGVNIKCVKVIPYKIEGQLILDVEQVIPCPDVEDYQIKLNKKSQEENKNNLFSQKRYQDRYEFWTHFITYNSQKGGLFASSLPTKENWLGKSVKGFAGVSVCVVITHKGCRADLFINTGDKDENKSIFDFLASHKEKVEKEFKNIEWERNDSAVTSMLRVRRDLNYLDDNSFKEIADFFMICAKQMLDFFAELGKQYKH